MYSQPIIQTRAGNRAIAKATATTTTTAIATTRMSTRLVPGARPYLPRALPQGISTRLVPGAGGGGCATQRNATKWTDGRMDGRTAGRCRPAREGGWGRNATQRDGRTDGRTDGWTDGRTAGRTDGWTDGRTAGRTDGWAGRRLDGRTAGQADGWTDGPVQSKWVPKLYVNHTCAIQMGSQM